MTPIVLAAALLVPPATASNGKNRVTFPTSDKVALVADFHTARGVPRGARAPAAILVHDARGSRQDLAAVAEILATGKVSALALDLRGHGESEGPRLDAEPAEASHGEATSEKPFLKMTRDLDAAAAWLRARSDVDVGRIGVVGVGAGGAVALRFAANEDFVRAAVLVAPTGQAYGYDLCASARRVHGRALLVVAAPPGQGEVERLFAEIDAPDGRSEKILTRATGKGVELLRTERGLERTIAHWLRDRLHGKRGD